MWEPVLTAIVLVTLTVVLIRETIAPQYAMFVAMVTCCATGIIKPEQGLAGFANAGMLTIAALFVIAAALERTNALYSVSEVFFGRPSGLRPALLRILSLSGFISVFTNNTTQVAIFTPIVLGWSKRNQLPASYFLMPISFIVMLGGLGALIGTSTNLVVHGLMEASGMQGMSMFELAWVGVPLTVLGLAYLVCCVPFTLRGKFDLATQVTAAERSYICDVILEPACRLVGKSVEEAGLRHLEGLFLVNIKRGGELIGPVSPRERLEAGDRLIFAGRVETIGQLQQIPGVKPGYEKHFSLQASSPRLRWFEVVISRTSPLVDQTLRDVQFRSRYDAAVLAVHRPGEALKSKLGDIVFAPGDVLLIEAAPAFYDRWRHASDFFLVAPVDGTARPDMAKAWRALAILVAFVGISTFTDFPIVVSAFLGAIATVVTGCLKADEARDAVVRESGVLLLIASSFGVGDAIETSGLAQAVAHALTSGSVGMSPLVALGFVLLVTSLFTEIVTNNAAAAIMFPLALATAHDIGVDPRPFAIAVAVAASLAFMTPFGYQTNLMVYGPGGYQFSDFVRLGTPLKLVALLTAWIIIPFAWPFQPAA